MRGGGEDYCGKLTTVFYVVLACVEQDDERQAVPGPGWAGGHRLHPGCQHSWRWAGLLNSVVERFVADRILLSSNDLIGKVERKIRSESGVKWAIFRSESGSGSVSGSAENVMDPDPEKWCCSFGSGSGSPALILNRKNKEKVFTIYLKMYISSINYLISFVLSEAVIVKR